MELVLSARNRLQSRQSNPWHLVLVQTAGRGLVKSVPAVTSIKPVCLSRSAWPCKLGSCGTGKWECRFWMPQDIHSPSKDGQEYHCPLKQRLKAVALGQALALERAASFVGPARLSASPSGSANAPELEEEDELDRVPTEGPPWWRRFPDFVPLSALKWGINPRQAKTW